MGWEGEGEQAGRARKAGQAEGKLLKLIWRGALDHSNDFGRILTRWVEQMQSTSGHRTGTHGFLGLARNA